MELFSINNVVGPEGICPMLLVYGATPSPARSSSQCVNELRKTLLNPVPSFSPLFLSTSSLLFQLLSFYRLLFAVPGIRLSD